MCIGDDPVRPSSAPALVFLQGGMTPIPPPSSPMQKYKWILRRGSGAAQFA